MCIGLGFLSLKGNPKGSPIIEPYNVSEAYVDPVLRL